MEDVLSFLSLGLHKKAQIRVDLVRANMTRANLAWLELRSISAHETLRAEKLSLSSTRYYSC
jgi:hypothetical protein